jgi:predicted RNase H-like HicB family nuclease
MSVYKISLVIEPDEVEFHGFCPFLKGLHTCGKTREETLMNLGDALNVYMQAVIDCDGSLPEQDWDNVSWYELKDVMDIIQGEELNG